MNAFIQHMKSTYDKEELKNIADFGCEGGVNGMIWYEDTTELFDTYESSIFYTLRNSITNLLLELNKAQITGKYFKNEIVWQAAQEAARYLVYKS